MSKDAEQKVDKIKEGIVIDHIPPRKALKVIEVLGVDKDFESVVSVGMNFKSKKSSRKDVVKIENKDLTKEELDRIALFAPKATINIIKDYKVSKKLKVDVPDSFQGVIMCNNPKCITRNEEVKTKFTTVTKEPLILKCHYCEREIEADDIRLA